MLVDVVRDPHMPNRRVPVRTVTPTALAAAVARIGVLGVALIACSGVGEQSGEGSGDDALPSVVSLRPIRR